jgi:hypothetical protein
MPNGHSAPRLAPLHLAAIYLVREIGCRVSGASSSPSRFTSTSASLCCHLTSKYGGTDETRTRVVSIDNRVPVHLGHGSANSATIEPEDSAMNYPVLICFILGILLHLLVAFGVKHPRVDLSSLAHALVATALALSIVKI